MRAMLQLVHEVSWGHCAGHHVHVDRGAGESGRGGVRGRLGRGDGARVEVEVAHLGAEVWRGWAVHAHGPVRVLLLDLDGFGHLRVLLLVALQLALQLCKRHPEHRLEVAHEAVDVAFSRHLVDDVLVVVVAQASAELLVVHLGLVLAGAPPPCHLLGVNELELPVPAGPRDAVLAVTIRQ